MRPNLRQTIFLLAILTLVMILLAWISPDQTRPTQLYYIYMGGLSLLPIIFIYFLMGLDFEYVKRHHQTASQSGVAKLQTMGDLTIVYLGPQSLATPKMVINLIELSQSTRYLGRWTVYTCRYKGAQVELWHDLYTLGGQWYYLIYA